MVKSPFLRFATRSSALVLGATYATLARAQTATPGGTTTSAGTTIGDRISGTITDMVGPIVFVVALLSFIAGLYLLAKGIMKLKDIGSGQGRGEAGGAFLCIVAATALICLPELAGVGVTTVFGGDGMFGNADLKSVETALDSASGNPAQGAVEKLVGFGTIKAPDNCLAGSSSSASGDSPASCMAKNVAMNIAPIGVMAIFIFGFVIGLVTFASCIMEFTKMDGQQRSPGLWGKLLGSVLLMNAIFLFQLTTKTFLGSDGTITTHGVNTGSDMLSYTASGSTTLSQYASIIGYCFVILTFFGAFAFVKGIFLMKEASEGRGQATYSHGMVFLLAGILLANAKVTTCMVLTTITGGGSTAGFC